MKRMQLGLDGSSSPQQTAKTNQADWGPRRHIASSFNPRKFLITLLLPCVCGGCTMNQLRAERDALREENLELRHVLASTREALDASESQRGGIEVELADAHAQLTSQPSIREAALSANTGFLSIPGVETIAERGRITVRIPGDVLFDSGKIALKPSARRTLSQVARVITQEYAKKMIRISGYTDTDPIRKSRWTDNLELSMQRAAAVHRYLQKQGVSTKRIYAAGFGPWHPRNTRAKSRRVEIVVELD